MPLKAIDELVKVSWQQPHIPVAKSCQPIHHINAICEHNEAQADKNNEMHKGVGTRRPEQIR